MDCRRIVDSVLVGDRGRTTSYTIELIGLLCMLLVQSSFQGRAHAQAEQRDDPEPRTVTASARSGMFLPLTMAPGTTSQRAFARGYGGYDSARRSSRFEGTADATLIGPLAARITMEYGEHANAVRPGGGLRLQALRQDRHGIDLTVAVLYRAEGFTEAEGEIEGLVAFARRIGHWGLFANLVYGQDPEGNERDGEVRWATLYELGNMQIGGDARVRLNLGEENKAHAANKAAEAEFDGQAGALMTYALGPVALLASAGFCGVIVNENFRPGFVGLAGLGGSL